MPTGFSITISIETESFTSDSWMALSMNLDVEGWMGPFISIFETLGEYPSNNWLSRTAYKGNTKSDISRNIRTSFIMFM